LRTRIEKLRVEQVFRPALIAERFEALAAAVRKRGLKPELVEKL
jgi:hypothetical protein